MNALLNAHTPRGRNGSPCVGLISSVLPEAQCSQTGVSSKYVSKENNHCFALHNKNEIGKKKRILAPLFPNFIFVYAQMEIFALYLDVLHIPTDFIEIIK